MKLASIPHSGHKMCRYWLRKLQFKYRPTVTFTASSLLLALTFVVCCSITTVKADEQPSDQQQSQAANRKDAPSMSALFNHKTEPEHGGEPIQWSKESRQGRQYDGTMSASGTGLYGSIAGDSAYVAQLPVANYASATGHSSAYTGSDMSANYNQASYQDPISMVRGYSGLGQMAPGYHSVSPSMYPPGPMGGFSSGLLSGSSMFPLMGKGFDISEIVCTAIAVAVGAVIVGAPFILIYLFVMNQINGNGPAMSPNGGAISLTGPTASTTVNGRKKRQTGFPEALLNQLSPLVNSEQVAQTFKALMNSIAKYQV